MTAGVVPDSASDTLLMYAYAQKGVQKATLKIDRDEENLGKSPSVTYQVELDVWAHIKWRMVGWAKKQKNPILRKLILLFLAKMNAPIFLAEGIAGLARDYLPGQYSIKVEIKDE